jgi:DNA polymerase
LAHSRRTVIQEEIFAPAAAEPQWRDREDKSRAMAEFAEEVAPCKLCKLHRGRTQTVFGVGSPDANLVFIGEAPGRDEDLQGEPFVGRAGRLLNDILAAIHFRREEVYICNILKCRPPENRDPEREEVEACEPYLKRQLDILEPNLICCLGRVAAKVLLGTTASLTAMRETVQFYEGIPVMATYHPAALLRNPHWKRPAWEDFRKLRALYDALQKK